MWRTVEQRIGADEVLADGLGPSPLNSVFNTFRGDQQTDCVGRVSFRRVSDMERPSTQVRHPIPVGAARSSNQGQASWPRMRAARPGFPRAGSQGFGNTARSLPWAKATGAHGVASPQPGFVSVGRASGSPAAQRYGERVPPVPRIRALSNNGVQLTRSARCAPFPFRSWGQSLRAALAADPECWAGYREHP
jgi:hypothetical protein